MKGFDPDFRDLPHYIYAITARIWEGRQVGAIRKYYAGDCPVRSPEGLVVGSDAVVAATLATLAEFPDRRLLGEEVVWCGDDARGYLSSHRILSTATHAADGVYGRATQRRVQYRVIADCVVRANQVREEWLVRDQAAVAKCLGLSAREMARRQIENGDGGFFTPAADAPSNYEAEFSTDADAESYRRLWEDLWRADVAACRRAYHPAAALAGPGGAEHAGHADIERFHIGYLSALADARFEVHDLTCVANDNGKSVAMRWAITATHSGRGVFAGGGGNGDGGRDDGDGNGDGGGGDGGGNGDGGNGDGGRGAPLYVLGISHARFAAGKIIAEWVLLDEVAVWKQILSAAMENPGNHRGR